MSARPPALWEDGGTARRVHAMLPVSLALHGLLFGAVAVAGSGRSPIDLAAPVYEVALIAPVMKGSPGDGAKETVVASLTPPAPPSLPPEMRTPPDPDEIRLPSAKSKTTPPPVSPNAREDALARLQREQALKRAAEAAKAGKVTTQTLVAANAKTPATTPGTGGTGAGGEEYGVWNGIPGAASYERQIQAIVNERWLPPTWISADQPKQCIIHVWIHYDGKIGTMEWEVRSGDSAFDQSAMGALMKSDPLPPPPLATKQYLAKKGISIRFDSRTKLGAKGRR